MTIKKESPGMTIKKRKPGDDIKKSQDDKRKRCRG